MVEFARITRKSFVIVGWLLATLLVLAALVVGVGRHMIADVGLFRASIEEWVSVRSGYDIRLETITGEWQRASPYLFIDGVTIRNKGVDGEARIGRIEVKLIALDSALSL